MFQLDRSELLKLDGWLKKDIYPRVVERQLQCPKLAKLITEDPRGHKVPYTGAIGGGLTYSFTPPSLGTVVKVTWNDGVLNETIDLTDYNLW